jgi:transposase InsO family protein
MDAEFCIAALEEAMARFGVPEIFNTDQGSQFTSPRFTDMLKDAVDAGVNLPRSVECTPEAGQFQAAVSTRGRACFSS